MDRPVTADSVTLQSYCEELELNWKPLHTVSPVYQYVVCRAVVLDLVHADSRYVVLRGPPDGGRTGREIRHADPLLVRPGLTPAHVGLDGCGNVGRPRVRVQFRVKVRRRVDDQLHRGRGFPGCIRSYAGELSRILEARKEKDTTFSLNF